MRHVNNAVNLHFNGVLVWACMYVVWLGLMEVQKGIAKIEIWQRVFI